MAGCEAAPGLIAPAKHALFSPCPATAIATTLISPGNGTTDVPSTGTTITVAVAFLPGSGTPVLSLLPLTLTPDSGAPVQTGVLSGSGFARYTGSVPPLVSATHYTVTSQNQGQPTYVLGCFTTQ